MISCAMAEMNNGRVLYCLATLAVGLSKCLRRHQVQPYGGVQPDTRLHLTGCSATPFFVLFDV